MKKSLVALRGMGRDAEAAEHEALAAELSACPAAAVAAGN
jgi:hypothetical protein